MRHAIVNQSGLVVNVVEIEDGAEWRPPDGHRSIATNVGDPGDTWDGSAFTKAPPAPLPPQPTPDEIYDRTLQNSRVLRAVVLALNDGSFVPGSNRTPAQLRAIIKAKM